HQTRTRWPAYWRLDVAVLEEHTLCGQGIQVRGVDEGVAVGAESVEPLLVGAQQQDVRTIHVLRPPRCGVVSPHFRAPSSAGAAGKPQHADRVRWQHPGAADGLD